MELPRRLAPLSCLAAAIGCAHVGAPRGDQRAQFYTARPYGSEAQFNPLSQLLNEGFNNLQLYATDLGIARQPYGNSARNLRSSVVNVERAYRAYGWRRAAANELLPLTGEDGGQWVPNYMDHLIGSGMVSARMTEWFAQHGVPWPGAMSFLTMTASHVLNEVIEQPNPLSVDAATDLLLFDNLGFLAFRSARVRAALSGRVQLTSWAGQPVLTVPTHSIENSSQNYVLRFPLPRTDRWRGFYFYGLNHVIGASRDLGDGRSLSFGVGAGSNVVEVSDTLTDTRTVTLGPRFGAFYDRDGSLLASLLWENSRGTLATLNVYPGLLRIGSHSPGFWLAIRARGGHRFGLTMPLGIGLGYGAGEVR